ncbi:hypothetical protein F4779DRAFT_639253 [Xylariaceae sp. FL0662B]|nr:hypothetical protein F4779DRAFT_639253 [Xylariaceae sp. FL0662B]
MQVKAAVLFVAVLPFAGQTMGSALIAYDSYYACNCPMNCNHSEFSSCEYYSHDSVNSVISGMCLYVKRALTCIAG